MKIKRSEVHAIINSILALDQPVVLSSEPDGKQKTVKLSIDGYPRYVLSLNLKKLQNEQESINAATTGKFKELATPEERETGQMKGPRAVQYNEAMRALLESEVDIPLEPIDIGELKLLDKERPNPVPLDSLMNLLGTVIIGELKKP